MSFPAQPIARTFFILLAALFPASSHAQEAAGASGGITWAMQAPWSSLSYTGAKMGTKLTVKATLAPAAQAIKQQPWAGLPQTSRCASVQDNSLMLSTSLSVSGMLRNSRYSEGLWFDQSGSAQKRLRYNQEPGDFWLKEYCWEDTGVRRSKLVPAGEDINLARASGWSEENASRYPLPEEAAQCATISDPALLIVLASAMAKDVQQPRSVAVCSFGRQQLFRLTMTRETAQGLDLSYQIQHKGQPTQKRGDRIESLVYRISPENMQAGKGTESFSLMGLEKDIRIFVDPITFLPIRLSGNTKLAGKVELNLREAQVN